MENPIVWKGLKFYPTPRVGRSRENPSFVHQSGTKLNNMASKTFLSLSECLQTIFILNLKHLEICPGPGWGRHPGPEYQNHIKYGI